MSEPTFGMRLREALSRRGMSMATLSEKAGIPYSSVQNYVADKQLPGAEALLKIKRALSVRIDWLLAGDGEMFAENIIVAPRPFEMKDYQELRAKFINFDDMFSISDQRMLEIFAHTPEGELKLTREFIASALVLIPDRLSPILAGRKVDDLSLEEAREIRAKLGEGQPS